MKDIEKRYGGWYGQNTKNIYLIPQNERTTEELKQAIANMDIEELLGGDNLGVLCHETLHALSGKGLDKINTDGMLEGRGINEGVTQILTEKMVPSAYKTYQREVHYSKILLETLGDDIIQCYLDANFDGVMKIAENKAIDVRDDVYSVTRLLDYLLDRETHRDIKEEDFKEYISSLINKIGIDFSTVIEYDTPIPSEINEDILKKAIQTYLQTGEPDYEKIRQYNERHRISDTYPAFSKIFIETISEKNNEEINLEEYIKCGLLEGNEEIIAQFYFDNKKDLKGFVENVSSLSETIEEAIGEGADNRVNGLLTKAIEQMYGVDPKKDRIIREDIRFKEDVIDEIIMADYETLLSTVRDEDGCLKYSWKEMITRIENFEYYTTDTGFFVIDSKNGEIIAGNIDGEIVNVEENASLLELSTEGEKVIKYTTEDEKREVFLSEKDENGKYVLKGYVQDENGKYVEIDVGLGRDFCDDTTELDRQIMFATSGIKSSDVKVVVQRIQSDISRDAENENTMEGANKDGQEER